MCDSCSVIQTVQLLLALQAVSWVAFRVWGTRQSPSLLKERCGDEVPRCWVHLYNSGKLRKLGETLKGRMGCAQLFSYHQTIFCFSPLQPHFQPEIDIWKYLCNANLSWEYLNCFTPLITAFPWSPGSEHWRMGVLIPSVRKEVKMCLHERADRFKRALGGRLLGKRRGIWKGMLKDDRDKCSFLCD